MRTEDDIKIEAYEDFAARLSSCLIDAVTMYRIEAFIMEMKRQHEMGSLSDWLGKPQKFEPYRGPTE